MTFTFINKTIFWDILKWNRGQIKWDGGNMIFIFLSSFNYTQTILHTPKNNLLFSVAFWVYKIV